MLKSRLFALGLVGLLGVAGYFALRNTHASPVVTEKQAEGTVGPPAIGEFSHLARSRDGHMLATVNDNKSVALWDATNGSFLRVLESGEREWIYAPAFSPDASLLATPSNNQALESSGQLLLWDPATGQRLGSVDVPWVCCASFNTAGTLIAAAGQTTLYLVDPSTREIIRKTEMEHVGNGTIQAMEFNANGDLLATAKRNGKVELWQVPDLKLVRTFSVGPSLQPAPRSPDDAPAEPQAVSVTFAHNVPRLAANNSEGSIFVWDVNTGKEIVRYVSLNGSSLIYQIAKELASTSETKVHYPTVNRRVHDLVARGYLRVAGTKHTKSGAEAVLYEATIRGDFGSLASGLDALQEHKLIHLAGTKPGSPFLLLKHMLDRGLPFEFVRREFVTGVRDDLQNGYINIDALNEEVVCSAFATSMARRLRQVMGEGGREYVEQVLSILESLASPVEKPKQSPAHAFRAASAGAGAGVAAQSPVHAAAEPQAFAVTPVESAASVRRITKREEAWVPELRQLVEDML